ncbi:metallophosphoesterase family protein [Leptolyngbya sp. FACHB-671]|uniref:metallophosphoesterase family protein n=1 Tax=Leptolyngbya sp. FACHB-671 TaxID=2692812 RepID=UPI0016856355|nr:metallophosphoesterase family protein [Leptolyngbya sp. FACHB-671]MBD1865968.1 metallophosphoesterase family protein [Cyanobacteria bacterium FACHB-471]MBD2067322.1 metallophosphoesterase family protein [Leptolyngbya sp. FACHB-671]
MQVGVISDTHGLLRPEAVAALANSELILHAGDIGNPEVLAELEAIAPVVAVRGNNDTDEWAKAIAERQTLKIEDVSVHILHIGREFNLFETTGVQVVISGHSHKPSIVENNGILFLNPGSAGPRRFKLPISVAHLRVEGKAVHAEIVELAV